MYMEYNKRFLNTTSYLKLISIKHSKIKYLYVINLLLT